MLHPGMQAPALLSLPLASLSGAAVHSSASPAPTMSRGGCRWGFCGSTSEGLRSPYNDPSAQTPGERSMATVDLEQTFVDAFVDGLTIETQGDPVYTPVDLEHVARRIFKPESERCT